MSTREESKPAGLGLLILRSRGGTEDVPHADKFRIAMASLVGIAVGAIIVALVIIAQGSTHAGAAPWSSWSPPDQGKLGATEIAEHVAPLYRLTSAQQLDVVTLIDLANSSTGGTSSGSGYTIAVSDGSGDADSDLSLLSGTTIAYDVCGIGGSDCQLGGAPSSDRLLLLRREALELALYSFKYLPNVQNVVAVLPPGRTTSTASTATSTLSPTPPSGTAKPVRATSTPVTAAVLFIRSELQPWLDQPLDQTLTPYPPAVSELPLWVKTEEAGLVDQITERGLFAEKIESEQDGGNLLVLNPLPPS